MLWGQIFLRVRRSLQHPQLTRARPTVRTPLPDVPNPADAFVENGGDFRPLGDEAEDADIPRTCREGRLVHDKGSKRRRDWDMAYEVLASNIHPTGPDVPFLCGMYLSSIPWSGTARKQNNT